MYPCQPSTVSSERSVEQVMVHTLQMELEGTRDTVIGLERRLDDLHDDLSSISRNVDSLLRLISQSPCPSNMYLSSHSLQPSYNPSPSPNPNMYPTPSFYFSQSTDNDMRDSISLRSATSPAPDNWPGYGYHNRNDQFLSPYQTYKGGFDSASPLASPRVNFSQSPLSGYFSSLTRQGSSSINASTDCAKASEYDAEKSGSSHMLHSPDTTHLNKHSPFHQPLPVITSQSPLTINATSPMVNKVIDGIASPLAMREIKSRPSNLSPLQSRSVKSLFVRSSKSLQDSPLAKCSGMAVSATKASSSLVTASPTSHQVASGSLGSGSPSHGYQDDCLKLSQLEPCNAKSGHCDKADALRSSSADLYSLTCPSPPFGYGQETSGVQSSCGFNKTMSHSSTDSNVRKSLSSNRLSANSPTETHSQQSSRSPSPRSIKTKNKLNLSLKTNASSKTPSPEPLKWGIQTSPTIVLPPNSISPRAKRPQSLSPSFKKMALSFHTGSSCGPEDIEFIDCEPFPEKALLCPVRNYSPSLSQLPVNSSSTFSWDPKRSRSASTSAISQCTGNSASAKIFTSGRATDRENLIAPLGHVESFSDLQQLSEV